MSQSERHRSLVIQVLMALEIRYPSITFIADLQQDPGDPLPQLIGGYRPDIFSGNNPENTAVIAEAKTDGDLDNRHTTKQVSSFIDYLEKRENGCLVLSVTGCGADRAKTFLRFMKREKEIVGTNLFVYDGCDFWLLESVGGRTWHLS